MRQFSSDFISPGKAPGLSPGLFEATYSEPSESTTHAPEFHIFDAGTDVYTS